MKYNPADIHKNAMDIFFFTKKIITPTIKLIIEKQLDNMQSASFLFWYIFGCVLCIDKKPITTIMAKLHTSKTMSLITVDLTNATGITVAPFPIKTGIVFPVLYFALK